MRDLEAERRAREAAERLAEHRAAESKKNGRMIWLLGLAPFIALAAFLWRESAYMGGYIRGWNAGHSGKSLEQGLRADQTSTP